MTSPLSMLKKTRRIRLLVPVSEQRGGQTAPTRESSLKEFQTALAAADGSPGPSPVATPVSDAASVSKHKGAPPSNFELMSAMMQRLTLLEKKTRSQEVEIKKKTKQVSVLEEKLKSQKKSGTEAECDENRRDDLKNKCQQLQDQVNEMERFLNDYGLIWVGERKASDASECGETRSSVRGTTGVMDFHMNFDLVLQRVKELNVLAGKEETFVQATSTGAQLARKEPVQLTLYSNGIVMFDGPFRSYQEHSTQDCMQDLMEGYFPMELQGRFPDGVPFEVHDKRDEEFVLQHPWERFPGEGHAVREENRKSPDADNSPGKKKLSMDQFLNKLPKVVVKAGRVIDIRDSVKATLQASSDSGSVILIDTPALQAMKKRLQSSTSGRPQSSRDVITLRVKSEDGNHTYVLKMRLSETIGHLRQYLDTHRGGQRRDYDIISAYPQCRYDDDCQTLQSCGLMTNAALLLRKVTALIP